MNKGNRLGRTPRSAQDCYRCEVFNVYSYPSMAAETNPRDLSTRCPAGGSPMGAYRTASTRTMFVALRSEKGTPAVSTSRSPLAM